MISYSDLWDGLFDNPIYVLTSDQDWAPEWAVEYFLGQINDLNIPLHIFRTNPSPALDKAIGEGKAEQGWHPNFHPNSSHGQTIQEVIQYFQQNFPGAKTVRTHTFAEDTYQWRSLAEVGIVADSQVATFFQGYLMPLVHWTGIVRLPIYFEDDIFFDIYPSLNLNSIQSTLFTPGLKILNFHPTFVACNTPSRTYHEQHRKSVFGSINQPVEQPWKGRGTQNIFRELLEKILSKGNMFVSFHELVNCILAKLYNSANLVPIRK